MADNSAKPGGNKQPPTKKPWLKCGELGTYAELNKKKAQDTPPPTFERDHVPSQAAMLKAAKKSMPGMSPEKLACVTRRLSNEALTIAIPYGKHRKHSRTCGSKRNNATQIDEDSDDLKGATNKDLAQMQKNLTGKCADEYRKSANEVRKQDHQGLINQIITECPG